MNHKCLQYIRLWGWLILFLIITVACRPGTPKGILSEGKMTDLLYDMQMAQALATQHPIDSIGYYSVLFRQAVLDKYSLNTSDFDRNMVWYSKHTDRLEEIYDKVSLRLGDEAGSVGIGMASSISAGTSSDTINVWRGASSTLLSSQGRNRFTFEQQADTALRAGDILQWQFEVDWFYNEGTRLASAVLVIHYEGDSTVVNNYSVFSSGIQRFTQILSNRKVESIEGFIYQVASGGRKPKLMALKDICLLRIRPRRVVGNSEAESREDEQQRDSMAKVRSLNHHRLLRDSLLKADSVERKRPHFR